MVDSLLAAWIAALRTSTGTVSCQLHLRSAQAQLRRLPSTCWHDGKGGSAAEDALDDWQLQPPEGAEAKRGLQRGRQGLL